MPNFRDDAICIRHWDWSETSQTVSLLTREHGVLRAVAKGAKREKGSFSGGIELLTRGDVIAIAKPNTSLATLTSWDLVETFPVLRTSLKAHNTGMYMADLVGHFVHEGDAHPALFDEMLVQLRRLGRADALDVVLRFQWVALCETGYRPVLDSDARTNEPLENSDVLFFSPRFGGFVNTREAGDRLQTWRVRAETLDQLRRLATGTADAVVSGAAVDRAARLLAAYVREILGRDLPSLRALFGADLAVLPVLPR